MSSFSAAVPKHYTGTIENNGFWPDLELEAFMTAYGVDTRLDEATIRNLLLNAMLTVNNDLSDWVQHQRDEHGATEIGEVQAEVLNGRHLYIVLYEMAVYNRAKADFLHNFVEYSTTGTRGQRGQGEDRVEEKQEHADHYYASSLKAIRRIKGKRGARVKLIKGNIQGQPGQFF